MAKEKYWVGYKGDFNGLNLEFVKEDSMYCYFNDLATNEELKLPINFINDFIYPKSKGKPPVNDEQLPFKIINNKNDESTTQTTQKLQENNKLHSQNTDTEVSVNEKKYQKFKKLLNLTKDDSKKITIEFNFPDKKTLVLLEIAEIPYERYLIEMLNRIVKEKITKLLSDEC